MDAPLRVSPSTLAGLLLGLLLLVGLPSVQAQPTPPDSALQARLAEAISDTIDASPYTGALWGVHVTNLRSGRVLYGRNVDQNFVPASNVKLLTTAAVLDRLGPSYRYRTNVYVDGPIRNGVLEGNLIIRGSGDPSLGGYEQREDVTQVFRQWADSLKDRGIQHIEGDIVGDDDIFSDTPLGKGWSWDDVPYAYAAEIGGLVFNENKIDVEVTGQRPGEPAAITWEPHQTDFVQMVNRTRTVPRDSSDDEEFERRRGTNTIHALSRIHPNDIESEAVTVTDPSRYFTHVLREVLLQQGISVNGRAVDLDETSIQPDYEQESVRTVASYQSPPLRDLLRTLNHESRNLYAEQLLRTLAVEAPPDTTDEDLPEGSSPLGVQAVLTTLADAGVDTSRVQLVDGSGLSRQNLVSPRSMTRLLQHMWTHADATASSAFYQSLPTGGQDGTIQYRFRGGAPARGNVRAKTGTLTNMSALSGYVSTERGTPLAFVLFCNHHMADGREVRSAQDAVVNALADLPL